MVVHTVAIFVLHWRGRDCDGDGVAFGMAVDLDFSTETRRREENKRVMVGGD